MFNNINAIIEEIIKLEGFEVMSNHILFFSLLNDLAPMYEEERKILRKALDKQALLLLKKVLYDKDNKESIENFIFYLDEELGIKKEWIDFILECFEISKTMDKEHIEVVDSMEPKYNFVSFYDMLERAKTGDIVAQYIVAYCYTAGILVEKDILKGAEWYGKAGLKGCVPAQYSYALIVLKNQEMFSKSEICKAKEFLNLAAEEYHIWAMHYWAVLNSKKDRKRSIFYHRMCAFPINLLQQKKPHLDFYKLLPIYCEGISKLEDNFRKLAFEYEQVILNGSRYAMYNLALENQSGEFLSMDLEKAFMYFEMSAQLGDYRSWFELGYCYENGLGIDINRMESDRCYEKAEKLASEEGLTFIDREYFKEHFKNKCIS